MTIPGRVALATAAGLVAVMCPVGAICAQGALGRGMHLALERVGRFNQPMQVVAAPGDPRHLFVVQRPGTIKVVRRDGSRRDTFLDIRRRVNTDGTGALMSLAFPPNYRRSHRFYVDYSDRHYHVRVDEYKTTKTRPLRAAPKSRRAVLDILHPPAPEHYGGTLQFGRAGRLYVSTGDGKWSYGGDPYDNARHLGNLLGKILRIDPRPADGNAYTVPSSNPFVRKPGLDEIYSYGLRNPFRFSLDRKAGRIAIGDVGAGSYEEIDYATLHGASGANFGWPQFEGFHYYDPSRPGPTPAVDPIFAYPHDDPGGAAAYGDAVIGGYVVRARDLPSLAGRYIYTDNDTGQLRTFQPSLDGATDDRSLGLSVNSPSGFGEGPGDRIYVASLDGPVYHLRQSR